MFRRNLLAALPAFLLPKKLRASDEKPERRLETLRRRQTTRSSGTAKHCYELKPLCITVCDYDVEPGDPVRQFCEGKEVTLGAAASPAKAGEPVMIVFDMDINPYSGE